MHHHPHGFFGRVFDDMRALGRAIFVGLVVFVIVGAVVSGPIVGAVGLLVGFGWCARANRRDRLRLAGVELPTLRQRLNRSRHAGRVLLVACALLWAAFAVAMIYNALRV